MITRLPRARQAMRGSQFFDELFTAPGPLEVGVPGDGSYRALFGSEWVVLIDAATGVRRAYQRTVGGWTERTADPRLPTAVFGQVAPEGERRISLAFDQSARPIVALERAGQIFVTRWDGAINQYVQNVSFAGIEPCVWMDATMLEPAVVPGETGRVWRLGVRVLFHWLPTGTWVDSIIFDSDLLLFYLSTDQHSVLCRVQRQLYATVHTLLTHTAPLILDRAQALYGRYQLLVSDAQGTVLAQMLLSSAYIDAEMIAPLVVHPLAGGIALETIRADSLVFPHVLSHAVTGSVALETIESRNQDVIYALSHAVTGSVALEVIRSDRMILAHVLSHAVTGGVGLESPIRSDTMVIPYSLSHNVTGGVSLETIVSRRV